MVLRALPLLVALSLLLVAPPVAGLSPLLSAPAPAAQQQLKKIAAFENGVGGYHAYRIPSMLTLSNGDLLLFCEGRKLSSSDHDWNDVLTRRSTNGGETWGPIVVVHSESAPGKHVTIGNPSPVALTSHPGTLVLFFCRDNQDVASMVSTDNGLTWGQATYFITGQSPAFTALLGVPAGKNLSHVATGPPTSLQLKSGRVLIPTAFCYDGGYEKCASAKPGDWFAAVLYTDSIDAIVKGDAIGAAAGGVWKVSTKSEAGNECQVSQTQNGSLLLNQRTRGPVRQLSWSHDEGATWTEPTGVALAGKAAATCCGSTVFVPLQLASPTTLPAATKDNAATPAAGGGLLVFSGPDSASRKNLSLFTSLDSGESWQWLAQVDPKAGDAGGYSSLSVINRTHVGVAWEGSSLDNGNTNGLFFIAAKATTVATTAALKTDDDSRAAATAAVTSPDCSSAALKGLSYCDPTASADQRVADVLSRMNSSQKVARLVKDPAPQLSGEAAGIPQYAWGVEGQVMSFDTCLNQVGCDDTTNPLCHVCGVTFPMPPALGASFNTTLIEEIGSLVGDSVRALDNWNLNRSTHSNPPTPTQRALSVRGPYVNIMRDPRDGRNQERPSEDPWWCGEVGAGACNKAVFF